MTVPYQPLFSSAAASAKIPPSILLAVAQQESGFSPSAVNHDANGTEDVGIMQLNLQAQQLPYSFARNPATAIPYGANLLASLYKRYGSWAAALSAYNSGSPTGSPQYASEVLGRAKSFGYTGPTGSATGTASGPTTGTTIFGLNVDWVRWGLVGVAAILAIIALTRL